MFRIGLAAAFVALGLVAGQLLLPRLAERRLREELEASGEVVRVRVSAFPALKLLFGRADRVLVRMGAVRVAGQGEVADLLDRTEAAGDLDVSAREVRVGPLLVRDLRLDKRGDRLFAEAALTEADVAAASPVAVALRPVASGDGSLVLEARTAFLGREIAVRARLSSQDGALVVAPEGALAALATITVFSDPRVRVGSVGARERPDGFTVTADATLSDER